MQTVLDITRSINKAHWITADVPLDRVESLVRVHDIPEVVARMVLGRGVAEDSVARFLQPSLKHDFPDPFSMSDMHDMALYMSDAIVQNRKFAIFGDFDVDGATSSAIFYRFLKHVGEAPLVYIPDRLSEGYGPNLDALKTLKEQGADSILMLDCGTTAFDIVKQGRDLGLDILIFDHHEAEENLPQANFVINPKRQDDTSNLDVLAACGVVFLSCIAINNKLREGGYYSDTGLVEPDMREFLDIAALGTVCDMVPLTGPNRLFVRIGFKRMQNTHNVGLRALMDVSKISGDVSPYHAGFVLGPRINAGSRVHKADLGANLLCSDDPAKANEIAWILNDCNDKRKSIQIQMEHEAIAKIEQAGQQDSALLLVDDDGWHPGLSGLVAGRIKEKYNKPACVVTYAEDLNGVVEGRGSGRSIPGVHIAQAFIDARNQGLLVKGGGHAMAGGFTVEPGKLKALTQFLDAHVAEQMRSVDTLVQTQVDGVLSVAGARPDLVKVLNERVGPFGQDHPDPIFVFHTVRIHNVDIVGESHIRMMISDWEGGVRMKAMAFRAVGTDLGEALLKHGGAAFHVLGQLKIDTWTGQEKVEMHVKDAAPVLSVN